MLALGLLSQALVVGVSYTIPFIFGQGFASAQPILVVLAISLPLTGLVTPAADVLTALNRQGLRAACYLVVAVLFVGAALQATDGVLERGRRVVLVAGEDVVAVGIQHAGVDVHAAAGLVHERLGHETGQQILLLGDGLDGGSRRIDDGGHFGCTR